MIPKLAFPVPFPPSAHMFQRLRQKAHKEELHYVGKKVDSGGWLPDSANKNLGHLVKLEFQMNNK